MLAHCPPSPHTLRGALTMAASGITALGVLMASASVVCGDTTATDVMQVEEDWELVLASPAAIKTAPQVETTMSPVGNIDSVFARTTWNYREFPSFQAGGMQLQAWHGDAFLTKTNFGTNDLSTVSETVTWTQVLKTDGTVLTLKIADGQSVTWGAFGGSTLTLVGVINLPNLNEYRTEVSVDNSGITFGANRVVKLRIKAVRRKAADGTLLSTDSNSKVIHQSE
jgi:hypothetical protein